MSTSQNVLNNLDLDLLNNSLNNNTVQVPIGVAATVCDVNANVIAKQRKAGDYTCTAKTTSQGVEDRRQETGDAESAVTRSIHSSRPGWSDPAGSCDTALRGPERRPAATSLPRWPRDAVRQVVQSTTGRELSDTGLLC